MICNCKWCNWDDTYFLDEENQEVVDSEAEGSETIEHITIPIIIDTKQIEE